MRLLLFADDENFYGEINSIIDSINLQNNLDKFLNWNKINLLPLNIDKICKIVSFIHCKNPVIFNYSLNNTTLNRAFWVKVLGVHFSSDFCLK